MNKEEAIRKVESCLTDDFPIEEYGEVEEIIKALEQEPCEDAISRKAMLDYQEYLHGRMSNEENHKLWEFIKDLPSVTPAPKKCHNENHDYAECDQFVCSNCGIELQDWHRVERDIDTSDITYHQYEFKYCPNCGARIDSKLPTA